MLFNLLSSTSESLLESTSTGKTPGNNFPWFWVVMGVLLVFLIVSNAMNNKKRRAQMEAEKEKRNAIEPGFKVTTIGGIVGTVVSVDNDANTFVLQTGSDEQPSFLKFDKVAIYNSEDPNAPVEEPVSEAVFEEEESFADAEKAEGEAEEVEKVEETEEKPE